YLGHSLASLGRSNFVKKATLLRHELLDCPVIEMTGRPFLRHGYPPNRQVYVILDNRLALVRIEDCNGKPVAYRGLFEDPSHQRTGEEWEELLLSADRKHMLEALTWIGGEHWTGPEEDHVSEDLVKDARL